jgi:acyl-CoA thioesterase-1
MPILDESIPMPIGIEEFDSKNYRDKFRIVALGDSITALERIEHPQRWTTLLETQLGSEVRVVNAGIGGTSSSLGLFRWERDVTPVKPHCVVICFLLNDSHIRHYECRSSYIVQCTPDRMDANLCTMVERSRTMGAEPVFWTPPPVPEWPEAFNSPTHLEIQLELCRHYLLTVERVARDLEVPLTNFWRIFPSLADNYPDDYFDYPDGYHSNARSQPILAEGIVDRIRPIFEKWKTTQNLGGP